MLDEITAEARSGMDKAIEAFRHEIGSVRTGRASATLLDGIRVEYYGSQVPLNQVANVSVPEPRLITIQVFDKTAMPAIERGFDAFERWEYDSASGSSADGRASTRLGQGRS